MRAAFRTGDADVADAAQMLRGLISAASLTQAIGAALELGVFDRLATAPCDLDQLANATCCSRDGLERLLRVLVAAELLTQGSPESPIACTPLGRALAQGSSGGARGLGLQWSRYRWPVWTHLAASVRSGEPVRAGGAGAAFERLMRDPEAAAVFDDAMTSVTHVVATDVAAKLDLPGDASVVDVGGGAGVLVGALLQAHPGVHATLVDLPHALGRARTMLQSRGLLDRCKLVAADFFGALPMRADICLLMRVLHDWNDEDCRRILAVCRDTVPHPGRLCIVERLLPEQIECCADHLEAALSDLNMLVMLGGRERTATQFQRLLGEAGFRWERVTPLALGFSLIEARAVTAAEGRAPDGGPPSAVATANDAP